MGELLHFFSFVVCWSLHMKSVRVSYVAVLLAGVFISKDLLTFTKQHVADAELDIF